MIHIELSEDKLKGRRGQAEGHRQPVMLETDRYTQREIRETNQVLVGQIRRVNQTQTDRQTDTN